MSNQKLKIIYVLEILKKYSDEEHPLNAAEIIEKLEGFDIFAERKSVYTDLEALADMGFDIIKTTLPKKGWFLGERELEAAEIYMLSDAVRSANFITPKKTRELVDKLYSLLSIYEAKKNKNAVYFSLDKKCHNENIYYHIDKINRAIKENRQIKVTYSIRTLSENRSVSKKEKQMTINPYALAWQDDCYYLLGNYIKYDNLIHLRVDRISLIEETNEKARHFSEVSEYKDFFDVAHYTNKLFGMYSGESAEIELRCDNSIAEQVLDRFGEDIFIKKQTENTFNFSTDAVLSDALVTWIINFGEKLKVIKPEALINMVKSRAEEILEIYND